MKRNLNIIIMLIILVTACTGRENIGEIPSNTVCASLVNAKCTRCHYKTRICAALGTKSISKWGKTINFMVNQGADLTDEERQKIVACLSSLPQNSEVVCN